jgi:hypothetical protein
MYNYGYVQSTGVSIDRTNGYFNRTEDIYQFKNICAENYSYVNGNVILNKILGAEYSLVNFYRESGVFVLLNKTTDLSFNKLVTGTREFFNSDSSAKKCNCTTFNNTPILDTLPAISVVLSTANATSDILTSLPTTITNYPNGTIFTVTDSSGPPPPPFTVGDKYKLNGSQLEKQGGYYSIPPIPPDPTIPATLDFTVNTFINQTFTATVVSPATTTNIVNY